MNRAKNMQTNAKNYQSLKNDQSLRGYKTRYNQLKKSYDILQQKVKKYEKIAKFMEKSDDDPLVVLRKEIVTNIIDNDPKKAQDNDMQIVFTISVK